MSLPPDRVARVERRDGTRLVRQRKQDTEVAILDIRNRVASRIDELAMGAGP